MAASARSTNRTATTVTCDAIYRIQAVSSAPAVDLNVVFVGVDGVVDGLTGRGGENNEILQAALTEVGELWAQAGINLGTVTYADFGGDAATYTIVDNDEEFGDLLKTVDAADSRSITIFFVQSITSDDGASILGLSAGPPGAAGTGSTSKSGVVVTVGFFAEEDAAGAMGRLIAHEAAHFLGIFHTSEKDGSGSDPLGDTEECSDGDGDGTLSTSECGGKGAENLMWWSSGESSSEMTNDQGWVMERSVASY